MAGVRRTFLDRWAQGGAQTDPGGVKTQLGWVQEKPPYQYFNWFMARVDDMLAHFEEQAVPDWNVATPYLVGGLAMGSDRLVYRAVQANTGNDPVLDATDTNWAEYVPAASDSEAGVVELATGAETATGTDAGRAITPLGLLSRTATAARIGLIQLASSGEAQALTDAVKGITPATLGTVLATTGAFGLSRLATAAEVLAGSVSDRVVTPSSLGALANTLAATGYQTFPGGLTLQWGSTLINNTFDIDVTLPIAFPNGFLKAFASSYAPSNSESQNDAFAEPNGLTQIRLASAQVNRNVHWLALGH